MYNTEYVLQRKAATFVADSFRLVHCEFYSEIFDRKISTSIFSYVTILSYPKRKAMGKLAGKR